MLVDNDSKELYRLWRCSHSQLFALLGTHCEGDTGNPIYFLNSGTVKVATKDGSRVLRKQDDFFGEGALLHSKKKRSATIKCVTPVYVIEISRKYFDNYLASDELGLALNLREKTRGESSIAPRRF